MKETVTHNRPLTEEIPSPRVSLYRLKEDMIIKWRGHIIRIPAGYTGNGASVPMLLWPLVPPTGLILYASIPHDYGYELSGHMYVIKTDADRRSYRVLETFSKSEVDALLRDIHRQDAADWIDENKPLPLRRIWLRAQPWIAWAGVAIFGWGTWLRYKMINRKAASHD